MSYHDKEGLSQSMLKLFARNPVEYYQRHITKQLPQEPPTESMVKGLKVEAFLRGSSKLNKLVIVPEDVLGGRAVDPKTLVKVPKDVLSPSGAKTGKAYKDWVAEKHPNTDKDSLVTAKQYQEAEDKFRLNKPGSKIGSKYLAWKQEFAANVPDELIVTSHQWDREAAMYATIADNVAGKHGHAAAKYLLCSQGKWHVSFEWMCPITGLLRKAETDRWFIDDRVGVITDLKVVKDPTPWEFRRQIKNLGYRIQMATYAEGAMAVFGPNGRNEIDSVLCCWVPIRGTAPHDVHCYEAQEADMRFGREWNRVWVEKFAKAQKEQKWVFPDHSMLVPLSCDGKPGMYSY